MQAVNTAMRQLRRELEVRTEQANSMLRENAAVSEESRAFMAQYAAEQAGRSGNDRSAIPVALMANLHSLAPLTSMPMHPLSHVPIPFSEIQFLWLSCSSADMQIVYYQLI